MCSFNISIIVSVKLFEIEKLRIYHTSCETRLIFYVRIIFESIHHISEKSQARHFSHQCRISIKSSHFSDHSSLFIYNFLMHSDFNLESQASYKKYEIIYVLY